MSPLLIARQVNALRAVAMSRGGLRITACRTSILVLHELGLVEERDRYQDRPSERVWLLTAAGQRVLAEIGRDDP